MQKHLRTAFFSALLCLSVLLTGGISASAVTIIPSNAKLFHEHYYMIYYDLEAGDEDAEEKAKELCKKRGGHLAVVEDDAENDKMLEMLKDAGIEYRTYLEIESMYAEMSGFDVKYDDDGRAFNSYDAYNMNKGFTYICEWDKGEKIDDFDEEYGKSKIPDAAKEFEGRQYKLFANGLTHNEAAKFCRNIGGHLVTISSPEEEAFVIDMIKADDSGRTMYWTGLFYNRDTAKWENTDDTPAEYLNWTEGEPNNYLNGAVFCAINRSAGEYEEYKWVAEHDEYGSIKDVSEHSASFGFICEWDKVCNDNYFHASLTSKVIDKPSCITKGKRAYYCSECGKEMKTEEIELEPHTYKEKPLFKNYKLIGFHVMNCPVCGDVYYSVEWSKIWFLPSMVLLIFVAIAAFISSYRDYRKDYGGEGAPPVWALFMSLLMILAAAAVVYFIFIR